MLQTLWEARLPGDRTVLGVPRGWSDENEWDWAGLLGIRRAGQGGADLTGWILGDAAPAAAVATCATGASDDSHHLLFSRSGEPGELDAWIVSRAWLVAICSGLTLVLGFIAIFAADPLPHGLGPRGRPGDPGRDAGPADLDDAARPGVDAGGVAFGAGPDDPGPARSSAVARADGPRAELGDRAADRGFVAEPSGRRGRRRIGRPDGHPGADPFDAGLPDAADWHDSHRGGAELDARTGLTGGIRTRSSLAVCSSRVSLRTTARVAP